MSIIVRSIDVGYGNTKFVVAESEGEYIYDCFESSAVVADLEGSSADYNVVRVPVSDKYYFVGHDSYLVSNAHSVKPLHENYIETEEYMALMKGVLKMMNIPLIDVLVIGLPVRLYRSRYALLKNLWKGNIYLGDDKYVQIRNVHVTIQPMGAYMDYRNYAQSTRNDNFTGRTLLVDPGWQTLDWMTVEGLNPIVDSTDSNTFGINGMLCKVARTIVDGSTSELPFPSSPLLTEVDSWIRSGEISLFGGKFVTPVAPYMKQGLDYVDKAIESMFGSLSQRHAIQEVVLSGGAAAIYRQATEKSFPHHSIVIPADPVYANVRGYQQIGLEAVRKYESGKNSDARNQHG